MTADASAIVANDVAPDVSKPAARRRPLLTPRRSNILLTLLAAMFVPTLTSLAMPQWFGQDLALTIAEGAALAVAAISLNVLTGYAGQISLGHGALLGVGAFAAGLVTSGLHLPMWVGLPLAGVVAGLISLVVGFPALRLRGLYLAVVTITFGFAMYNSILRLDVFTGGSAGVQMTRRLWGSVNIVDQAQMLAAALVVLVLAWLLDQNVTRTRLGRAFRALSESEPVAESFGVAVARDKLLAFVLSGALGGVAGALFGFCVYLVNSETFFPTVGVDYSLILVIVVVVGGLGSRAGVAIAAFVLTLFPFALVKIFPNNNVVIGLSPIIGSALLIYTVARHPGGFAGTIKERREHRGEKLQREWHRPTAGRVVVGVLAAIVLTLVLLRTATGSPFVFGGIESVGLALIGIEVGRIRRRVVPSEKVDADSPMPRLPSMPRPADIPRVSAVDSSAAMLEVHDVTMRFGGLLAVGSASVTVPAGKIVGLIGPNGAGKTTLFNCISGLLRPVSGTVMLAGRDVSQLPAHERARLGLARTFQQIGLAKELTILENMLLAQHLLADYDSGRALLYAPRVAHVEAELRERAMAAIEALGFTGREHVQVRLLSGGQQRIVEVACALLTDPLLLMLDEPSAGMSPAASQSLADRLRDLRDAQGRTVLLIEHNVPLVLDVCDHVYVLNFGEVLADGTPEDILAHPDVISAYLGETAA